MYVDPGFKNPSNLIASTREKKTLFLIPIHGAAPDYMTQPSLPLRSSMNVRLPLQLSASWGLKLAILGV